MRTSVAQVKKLGGISDSVDVEGFIEIASAIVDELVRYSQYSFTHIILELIERNLACHYAFVSGVNTSATISSKSIAGASESYSRPSFDGKGNLNSPFGATAMQLDPSKKLIEVVGDPVSVIHLGTTSDG